MRATVLLSSSQSWGSRAELNGHVPPSPKKRALANVDVTIIVVIVITVSDDIVIARGRRVTPPRLAASPPVGTTGPPEARCKHAVPARADADKSAANNTRRQTAEGDNDAFDA